MDTGDDLVPHTVIQGGLADIAIAYKHALELESTSKGEQRKKARQIASLIRGGVNEIIPKKVGTYCHVKRLFDSAEQEFPDSVI